MPRHTRTRLLRIPQVETRTGFSRAEIYRRVIAVPPRFPIPVKCGTGSRFVEHEIEQWIVEQIANRDAALKMDDEHDIEQLLVEQIADRDAALTSVDPPLDGGGGA